MKQFVIWFAVFAALFAGLFAFTHVSMTANPYRVVIAFDDSYYMKDAWPQIALKLKSVAGRNYCEFFVLSNKEKISRGWTRSLDLDWFGQTRLFLDEYDVKDLVNASKYPEISQADTIYVFSTMDAPASFAGKGNLTYVKL